LKRLPKFRFLYLVIPLTILHGSVSRAQTEKEIEYRFKAVYILNFFQFVEWPDSAFENGQSPIVLAVLGDDPFGKILDETVQSEKIGSRSIVVKRFHGLNELGPCQALFISSSEKGTVQTILNRIDDHPVLTISDIEDFGDQGGDIGFYFDNNKIRFAINVQALKQSDLRVSSKLLRLAKIINPS
jgi:YfiR/HmsC-like